MNSKKNVIFIVVDSLFLKRIGLYGNNPSPSPFIDNLFSNNMSFSNVFSVGCPTEFAYPGLTTSTLPLDKGGYALGISNREITIAELLKQNGYKTGVFFEDHFRSNANYSRGFDDVFYLFDFSRFLDDVGDTIPYYLKMFEKGLKSKEECINSFVEYLNIFFKDVLNYCDFMIESIRKNFLLPSLLLHSYNFNEIKQLVVSAKKEFELNPYQYSSDLISGKENIFNKINEIVKNRNKNLIYKGNKYLKLLLTKLNLVLIWKWLFKSSKTRPSIKNMIYNFIYGQKKSRFVSAGYIVDVFLNWVDGLSKKKPFFAWIHTADIHELNFSSSDLENNENQLKEEALVINNFSKEILKRGKDYNGNILYDLSLRYTDLQIERLFGSLSKRNLLDNSLIVFTADHGHPSVEFPYRKDINMARDFYDELYHIPLAFINKDIVPKKMEGLYSSLDTLTMLLKQLDINPPKAFKGISFDSNSDLGRNYVIMEHLGPGPCDFKSKPIKISVRSNNYKIVFENMISNKNSSGNIIEIYNLKEDPLEKQNIYKLNQKNKELMDLIHIAKKRFQEIKNDNKIYNSN